MPGGYFCKKCGVTQIELLPSRCIVCAKDEEIARLQGLLYEWLSRPSDDLNDAVKDTQEGLTLTPYEYLYRRTRRTLRGEAEK